MCIYLKVSLKRLWENRGERIKCVIPSIERRCPNLILISCIKLSHYLDVIEQHLAMKIAQRSDRFLGALSSHDVWNYILRPLSSHSMHLSSHSYTLVYMFHCTSWQCPSHMTHSHMHAHVNVTSFHSSRFCGFVWRQHWSPSKKRKPGWVLPSST